MFDLRKNIPEFFSEVQGLSEIPDKFLHSQEYIEENFVDGFLSLGYDQNKFSTYDADQELIDYLRPLFNHDIAVRYQIIRNSVGPHKDVDTGGIVNKLMYVYEPGGNLVPTSWWTKEGWKDSKQITSVLTKKNSWYNIRIDKPHAVVGIENTRLTIVVSIKN